MNMRREAILWSLAISAAIALGLAVIWAAIALAFSRPNLAPLYFAAAPYRQDDYSAEGVDVARLNPLDPGLEQEVILEDQARGSLVLNVNYLELADQSSQTVTPPASTNTPLPVPTNPPLPMPTNPPLPIPTNTSTPTPTNPPLPMPTNPPQPTPINTSVAPKPTKLPNLPKPTKLPKPTNLPNLPKPTNLPNLPKPTKLP